VNERFAPDPDPNMEFLTRKIAHLYKKKKKEASIETIRHVDHLKIEWFESRDHLMTTPNVTFQDLQRQNLWVQHLDPYLK